MSQRYWVIISKRHKKLWKPLNKDDFYDFIHSTKEAAESVLNSKELKYYMAVEVEMKIVDENKKEVTWVK
jgi:hypothetical protein